MCLIVKYFGTNSWVQKETIEKLIGEYRKALMRRVFNGLLKEKQVCQEYYALREKNLMIYSMVGLRSRLERGKRQKKIIMEA